jgi:predicted DCC family thiol-disulfide oxidoreductase YuxK
MLPDAPLVVFDGICKFCSRAVQFIVRRDKRRVFYFVPLQTNIGARLLEEHGIKPEDSETFLLIMGGKAFVRSDAALEIARNLPFWGWTRVLRVVPRQWRDWLYGVLAKNRYRWFGRRDVCFVPPPEERNRFIDEDAT